MGIENIETITHNRMVSDLKNLGLREGDILLVHSSLKSIGQVDGGPDTVIDALLEVVGLCGTLMFPCFQKGSEYVLLRKGCVLDTRSAPSEQGLISETFRIRPGTIRSLSPTHSLSACGPYAPGLLAGHENCRVSAGKGSPFEKLAELNGKILLIGVTHACNTTLHYVENVNGAPTLCREIFHPSVIDGEGFSLTVPTYPHMPGLKRCYERVEDILIKEGTQVNGSIGGAVSRLVGAGAMTKIIGETIRQDPLFLIDVFTP